MSLEDYLKQKLSRQIRFEITETSVILYYSDANLLKTIYCGNLKELYLFISLLNGRILELRLQP